jgi:signal peptidase II
LTVALGLIMAGAMGNCYDRLALGFVRDFVYFHVDAIGFACAIFNFADNMLVIGACTLVVYALRPEKSPPPEPAGSCGGHTVEETVRRPDAAGCPSSGPSQSMNPV